jgi:iron-sulfur cluster assembly accessory protein
MRPHVLGARDPGGCDPPTALGDRILDKKRDQPAHELMNGADRFEARIKRRDLAANGTEKIDLANLGKIDEARAQGVVEVMRVIGDTVGECRGLCLGAGEMRKFEIMNRIIFKDRRGKPAFRITRGDPAIGLQKRAVMFDEPFQGLPSQIESIKGRVAAFELGDNSQRLGVMIEAAVRSHLFVEHILASVAKRRVAKIMRKRKRLGEIVVEAERAGKRACDLTDFERMGEPGTEMVALVRNEDLRLVGQPPEGRAMDDAVAITLKDRARWRMRLRDQPSAALCRIGGVRRARGGESGRKVASRHENLDCAARLIAAAGLPTYLTYCKRRQAGPRVPLSKPTFEVVKMSEASAEAAVELTENAARRIAEILTSEPAGSFLRIGVDGGGCSGFTYTYNISTEQSSSDLVIARDGATVAIDPVSLDLLRGSKIDFIDDVMGRMFKIVNPAATASCGCGSSFAI